MNYLKLSAYDTSRLDQNIREFEGTPSNLVPAGIAGAVGGGLLGAGAGVGIGALLNLVVHDRRKRKLHGADYMGNGALIGGLAGMAGGGYLGAGVGAELDLINDIGLAGLHKQRDTLARL